MRAYARLLVLLGAGVLLAGGLLLVARKREPGLVGEETMGTTRAPFDAREIEALDVAGHRRPSPPEPVAKPVPDEPEEPPPEPVSEAAAAPPLAVRFQVLEKGTDLPLPGHAIVLSRGASRGDARIRGETDDDGAARLELEEGLWELGQTVHVHVYDPGSLQIHEGIVPLERSAVIRVEPILRARGRLELRPELPYAQCKVAIYTPRGSSAGTELLRGRADLEADGRFECEFRDQERSPSYVLAFHHENELGRVVVAAEELLHILLELERLLLRVVDAEGEPVEEAMVYVGAVPGDSFTGGWTDAGGELELRLGPGTYEYAVGKQGLCPALGRLESTGREEIHDIVLTSVSEEDAFHGEVLSAWGEPVHEAVVTVMPLTENPNVAAAAYAQTRTDPHGRFALQLCRTDPLDLTIFHRDHGMVTREGWIPDEHELVLRFADVGRIRIQATVEASLSETHGLTFALVSASGPTTFHDPGSGGLIEDLPAGFYEVLARDASGSVYGSAEAEVRVARTTGVELLLFRATTLSGALVHEDGTPAAGLLVELENPAWSPAVRRVWGSALSDDRGAFRVFAGRLENAVARILRPDPGDDSAAEVLRTTLSTSSRGIVTVPDP